MSFDGIFLHLIKNEIKQKLCGFRVDKIYQPSKEELMFTFRTYDGTEKLLISAKAECPRIQLTEQYVENPKKPPMLTMLLRKHLGGAKLRDITQDGFERIVTFVFDATNDLGDPVTFRLITEIMGRHSNIILVDENGIIVDCVKKIDEYTSSVREVLPNIRYELPPQQSKLNVLRYDTAELEKSINTLGIKKSLAYQEVLQGISPIVARELEHGMTLDELKEHIAHPEPTVVIIDKPKDYTYFRPQQYGDLAKYKSFDTFSQLIDYYYFEQVRFERIKQRSNDLFHSLTVLQERAVRKAINRRRELKECENKEQLKVCGDLINANLYRLQKGSAYYELENFYDGGNTLRIEADVTLTPAQNAQKYYKDYRKKQVAESKLNAFIKQAEEEAAYLDSVIDALSRAETDSEITAIRTELYESGFLSKRNVKRGREKKLPPRRFVSSEGFEIAVGRNNMQNDELTLKTAKNYDLWFHVKDSAGSHVIVTAEKGRPFTDKLIREAAMLAAANSKAHASSNVPVDYTIVKNVHKPNGAKFGMVIYDNYKTEYVTPNEEELSEVKEIE
ncbi:MAG: fibronectin/fibrinogen-binding protein [Ruminococcaceae bacterium]|nr:fibronectin/fibrinogen-binding protein [Oscillospiraceae bacterium]